MPDRFHNPYNFIPSLARIKGKDKQRSATLGDAPPVGHHAYLEDRWSGTIQVRITVETPLLLADASRGTARPVGGEKRHITYGTRVDRNGNPALPVTSVKGMLRTAYEAVTNSRFSVLGNHSERLPYRMDAREGIRMIPAVVTHSGVDLLMGTTDEIPVKNGSGDWDVPGRLMYAAWLRRYRAGIPGRSGLTYASGAYPEHGEDVWFWAQRVQHKAWRRSAHVDDFKYWHILKIATTQAGLGPRPAALPQVAPPYPFGRSAHVPLADPAVDFIEANGKVFISNQNIKNKHDERVFFAKDTAHRISVPLSPTEREALERNWGTLIRGARDGRDDEIRRRINPATGAVAQPDEFLVHGADVKPAWSRHMYIAGAESMRPDTLCYVAIRSDAVATSLSAVDVDAIVPVQVSRRLFDSAPLELFGVSSGRRPALALEQLSPADRVFGWTHASGAGEYRGQLRVTKCDFTSSPPRAPALRTFEPVPLAILGSPKPQQGRFYAASKSDGTPMENGTPKADLYTPSQGLRGRKVYPHQQMPAGYWQPDANPNDSPGSQWASREFLRFRGETDAQNRSIRSWVNPGTQFNLGLQVTNLSTEELGALLWLLRLPEDHFLKVGGAKPLGFGSIHLQATAVDLGDGRFWRAHYRCLEPGGPAAADVLALGGRRLTDLDDPALRAVIQSFKAAVPAYAPGTPTFESTPFIKAFLRAAVGVKGPVHYPRAGEQPDPKGENFKWFTRNEKDATRRLALPSLLKDDEEALKLPFFEG